MSTQTSCQGNAYDTEKETTWIDAWIRWERNSKAFVDNDDHDEENTEGSSNDSEVPVQPTKTFSFQYELPNAEDESISLTLKGFPSESEEIWNSTGLTIWPSSHYLCEYLCNNFHRLFPSTSSPESSFITKNIIVELGSGLGRCGLLMHHLLRLYSSLQSNSDKQHNSSSHVYLTDGDTDTLFQLRANVKENTRETPDENENSTVTNQQISKEYETCFSDHHDISCHQLLWGKKQAQTFCDGFKLKTSNTVTDQKDSVSQEENTTTTTTTTNNTDSIDLIVGSDLIYVPQVIQPLFETVSVLLQDGYADHEETEEVFCDPSMTVYNRSSINDDDDDGGGGDVDSNKGKPMFLMAHSDRREGSSVTLNMVLDEAQKANLDTEIIQEHSDEGIYIIAFSKTTTE